MFSHVFPYFSHVFPTFPGFAPVFPPVELSSQFPSGLLHRIGARCTQQRGQPIRRMEEARPEQSWSMGIHHDRWGMAYDPGESP